jgi:pimeloyl-ACP methyl ester carboxylesterase
MTAGPTDSRADGIRFAEVNGVTLAFDETGPPTAPAVVLVSGAGTTLEWWDDAFVDRLARGDESGPRRVIRYDLRDSGESTTGVAGKPDYTARDLLDDLAALIERLGAAPAHLVGLSLGGGLVQQLALHRPELVATLTLLSTSSAMPGEGDAALPPPTRALEASFANPPALPDWSDISGVIAYYVEAERPYAGRVPLDEERLRAIVRRMLARAGAQSAAANQYLVADDGSLGEPTVEEIAAPTLVLHGDADPLLPLPHGRRLAQRIPGARLVVVPGLGHQNPPPPTWGVIVPEILRHTAAS